MPVFSLHCMIMFRSRHQTATYLPAYVLLLLRLLTVYIQHARKQSDQPTPISWFSLYVSSTRADVAYLFLLDRFQSSMRIPTPRQPPPFVSSSSMSSSYLCGAAAAAVAAPASIFCASRPPRHCDW
ncbi:uncharacterized protein J3D65DRAFT_624580 [Phyllosticta citribraziliensis]|uniref:Secreted protein n=1 Tax=Phyllosticta citribraziliensis TaxID=989973 RepID=A0ABR1LPQ4_9PEZI